MQMVAQFFGILGIISNVIGIQLKQKKHIMLAFLIANFLFAINFALLKAYSGAVICFIQGVETFINYSYDRNNKKCPKLLISAYLFVTIICGIFTCNNMIDILPVLSSVFFIMAIMQSKEKYIRLLTLIFISLFVIYDVFVGAYMALISDVIFNISTIISIIRYDTLRFKNR